MTVLSLRSRLARVVDHDVVHSFLSSPLAVIAGLVWLICCLCAIFAPWIAPYNPYDLASLRLADAYSPPALFFQDSRYLFGTDNQGRDILSAILYGTRVSLIVAISSTALAIILGVPLGLLSGYLGGALDAVIMRIADVQLAFPAILIALLIDGMFRAALPQQVHGQAGIYVLILSIGLSYWVQYARVVRGSTMVERNREYVQAARVVDVASIRIMLVHILPNVLGPVLVIATINLALAVVAEATLSFLGVGVSPNEPSLGTLIRVGQNYMFSGEWWIVAFPALALVLIVLSVNLLGDWLRDALNPKLR